MSIGSKQNKVLVTQTQKLLDLQLRANAITGREGLNRANEAFMEVHEFKDADPNLMISFLQVYGTTIKYFADKLQRQLSNQP